MFSHHLHNSHGRSYKNMNCLINWGSSTRKRNLRSHSGLLKETKKKTYWSGMTSPLSCHVTWIQLARQPSYPNCLSLCYIREYPHNLPLVITDLTMNVFLPPTLHQRQCCSRNNAEISHSTIFVMSLTRSWGELCGGALLIRDPRMLSQQMLKGHFSRPSLLNTHTHTQDTNLT